MTYQDPTTGEFVGEFESRDGEGNVTRRTEWFTTESDAVHFSKTGEHKSQVAQTIKNQIGFWALAEVGARNFAYDADSLYFECKPTTRIVKVKITLDPSDTYTVRVFKKDGTELYSDNDYYADMLPMFVRNLSRTLAKKKGH